MRTTRALVAEVALGLVVVLAGATGRSGGADGAPPSRAPGAAEAVTAGIEVERELLKADGERWSQLASRRLEIDEKTAALYETVEAAVKAEDAAASTSLDGLASQIIEIDRERAALAQEERALLATIHERRRRIALLEARVAELATRAEEAAGPMSGTWEITMLPVLQRGQLLLMQTGTLLSGTYALDGGFEGSLQGTLVNRKVILERIDSKLGRWGRYEGYLSPDGTRIRGSWSSLELAGQAGGEGQWVAVRAPGSP